MCVNLDDTTAELIADAAETLLAEGALDVWTTPIGMKKGRPGVMLSALCRESDQDRLAERVLELTGSFGVRFRAWDRLVLDRDWADVETSHGTVRVKIGRRDGRMVMAQPEFEDVRLAAAAAGVSTRDAMEAARAAAHALRNGASS